MKVQCPQCGYSFNIYNKLIPKEGRNIGCPKCRERFVLSLAPMKPVEESGTLQENKLEMKDDDNSFFDIDNAEYSHTLSGDTDVYQLICPGCGAAVEKPGNLTGNTFHCIYCGSVVVIKDEFKRPRQNIDNLLKLARFAEESGNYIQAYSHYNSLLVIDSNNPVFWLGKARNAGYISSYKYTIIDEMLKAFQYAISIAKENEKEELRKDAGMFIWQRCCDYLVSLRMLSSPGTSLNDTSVISNNGYYNYLIDIIKGMIEAEKYLPDNIDIINKIIHTCEKEIPEFGPPERCKFREDTLKIFTEKKKKLDPEYFSENEQSSIETTDVEEACILYLIILAMTFVLFFVVAFLSLISY
jgi:predicted Zn finger-like uncharacterized protein